MCYSVIEKNFLILILIESSLDSWILSLETWSWLFLNLDSWNLILESWILILETRVLNLWNLLNSWFFGIIKITLECIASTHHSLHILGSENKEGIHTRKGIRQFHTYPKSLLKLLSRVDASRNHSSITILSRNINTHSPPFVLMIVWHSVPL